MNSKLNHLIKVAKNKEDVERIKQSILDLAFYGELIKNSGLNDSASDLVDTAQKKRTHMIHEGKIKKEKPLSKLKREEMLFNIPIGWEWAKIGSLTKVVEYGTSQKASETGKDVPVLRMNNIQNGKVSFSNLKYVDSSIKDLPRLYLEDKDLLFNRTNSYELVGKTGIFTSKEVFTFASYLIRLRFFNDIVNPYYVNYYMNSRIFRKEVIEKGVTQQTGQANFNGTKLKNSPIPLPPLQTQNEIVNEIDKLFKVCDKLSQDLEKKELSSSLLNKTAFLDLKSLEGNNFKGSLEFIIENMSELLETKKDIALFKKGILSLAMKGKLVDQNPGDSTTSILLKQLKEEKEKMVLEKTIRKPKVIPPLNKGEGPHTIPDSWQWIRLSEIGAIIGGGTPKSKVDEYWCYPGQGIPWVTPADIGSFSVDRISRGRRDITHEGLRKSSAVLMPKGTVLFSSRAPIGYVAIAENEICTNQGFKSVIPFIMETNKFIYYYLKLIGERLDDEASGTTFKEISGSSLASIPFPLPPLNEQRRIVSKLENLFNLCDKVEECIEDRNKNQQKFIKTIV